jgi:hypothetical protein
VAETARVQVEVQRLAGEIAHWDELAHEHQERAAATREMIADLQQRVLPEHEQAAAEAAREAQRRGND